MGLLSSNLDFSAKSSLFYIAVKVQFEEILASGQKGEVWVNNTILADILEPSLYLQTKKSVEMGVSASSHRNSSTLASILA